MLNPVQLSRIDLNLLVLFQAVLAERHVGRAAAQLNLTPSAVSHGLKRLRKLLNDPLFLRTPKGVVPTARALELRVPVEDILVRIGSVMTLAVPFDPATAARRFIIAAPDAVLSLAAEPMLEQIGATAPNVDISLIHVMPEQLDGSAETRWPNVLSRLENRGIDLAMLPMALVPPRFVARRLYDEDFVVAMRQEHTFARAPTTAAFCAAQHLLVSFTGDPSGFIDDMLAKRGMSRRVALTVPSFMMALMHLPNSDLLSVLPRGLVLQHAVMLGLTALELPIKRKPAPIHAVVTKAALMDAGVAWLLGLLTELHAPHRRQGRRV